MLIDNLDAVLQLGNQCESGANSIAIDVLAWEELYPGLAVAANPGASDGLWVTYTRYGETTVYPEAAAQLDLDLTLDDDESITEAVLTWTPSDAVLDIAGQGTVVIHLTDGGIEKRSVMTATYVAPGHGAEGTPPEPLDDYIEKWAKADATITMLEAGADPGVVVTQDSSGTHFAFSIPYPSIP